MGTQAPLLLLYLILIMATGFNILLLSHLLLYLVIAFFMFFNLMLLIGTISFWLVQLWPLRAGINAIYMLLGGLYFPLKLLGPSFAFLQYNPFSLVTDVPARYISRPGNMSLVISASVSMLWAIIFLLLFKLIFKKGQVRYEGVGL